MTHTKDQLELQAHIERENKLSKEKAEEEGMTIFCQPTSDPDHWAEVGIYNVEEYQHEEAASLYSDMYKEMTGIRPRGRNMTTDEYRYEIDQMAERNREQQKTEEQRKKESLDAQAKKQDKEYQPNNPFSGLRDMMNSGPG